LGWVGKHTLLIHPQLGSWLLLGEIVTTLPLQTSAEAGLGPVADHCGTCTRCIDACPTRCITPHSVDASRCISYLTLEHRGPIAPELQAQMGGWIAGCDVCQEVCPFNERATGQGLTDKGEGAEEDAALPGPNPAYAARPPAPAIPLLDLLAWDEEARQQAFVKSALKRVKLVQIKRNALIAAGNYLAEQADGTLRARVEAIAGDAAEHDLVRLTARQVLDRLTTGSGCPKSHEPVSGP
jgi:epoxyqueuosine reductase